LRSLPSTNRGIGISGTSCRSLPVQGVFTQPRPRTDILQLTRSRNVRSDSERVERAGRSAWLAAEARSTTEDRRLELPCRGIDDATRRCGASVVRKDSTSMAPHVARLPQAVPTNKEPHPVDVSPFQCAGCSADSERAHAPTSRRRGASVARPFAGFHDNLGVQLATSCPLRHLMAN
jgi:hypothetical protein